MYRCVLNLSLDKCNVEREKLLLTIGLKFLGKVAENTSYIQIF